MQAFLDRKVTKAELLTVLADHAEHDRFRQDYGYWAEDTQATEPGVYRGDAVGCSIEHWTFDGHIYNPENLGGIHEQYEELFGIPTFLAWWEDGLFEAMTPDCSKKWPILFIEAINVGADLSVVKRLMLEWLVCDPGSPLAGMFTDSHIKTYREMLLGRQASQQDLFEYCQRVGRIHDWDYNKSEVFFALECMHDKAYGNLGQFTYIRNPKPDNGQKSRLSWRQRLTNWRQRLADHLDPKPESRESRIARIEEQADLLGRALLKIIRSVPGN